MIKQRAKNNKYSKKTVKSTEALRERRLLLSGKKPTINKRDTQILCYESCMKYISFGKAT